MKTLIIALIAVASLMSPAVANLDSNPYKPSTNCKYQKEVDAVISHASNIAQTTSTSPKSINEASIAK